jgi:uncharacterized protein YegJ (DUF2314 family)
MMNLRAVCSSAYVQDPSALDHPPDWYVGQMVKLGFPTGEETPSMEHMWVEVVGAEGDILVGFLANHPYFVPAMEFGDEVRFRREQIEVPNWGHG